MLQTSFRGHLKLRLRDEFIQNMLEMIKYHCTILEVQRLLLVQRKTLYNQLSSSECYTIINLLSPLGTSISSYRSTFSSGAIIDGRGTTEVNFVESNVCRYL